MGLVCMIKKRLDGTVHPTAKVARPAKMSPQVKIGKKTNIQPGSWLKGDITIGRYCAIGPFVRMFAKNHEMGLPSIQFGLQKEVAGKVFVKSKGGIRIGNDVWVGSGSLVLSGVTIGDGAVVGAGSVVTKSVEPYELVAGNPAKHVGYRFPKKSREKLLRMKWWDWSDERIRDSKKFFSTRFE